MTHTRVADLYLARSAKGSRKDNFKPTSCFGAATYAQLQESSERFKQLRIAKATVRLQNVLSAGDSSPLMKCPRPSQGLGSVGCVHLHQWCHLSVPGKPSSLLHWDQKTVREHGQDYTFQVNRTPRHTEPTLRIHAADKNQLPWARAPCLVAWGQVNFTMESQNYRIILGWKGPERSCISNTSTLGRDTFH